MENIMAFRAIKNAVCCMAVLLPLQLGEGTVISTDTLIASSQVSASEAQKEEPVPSKTNVVLMDLNEDYCDTNCFIIKNEETVSFISKTFKVNYEDVKSDLIERNSESKYDMYNIGRLTDAKGNLKTYSSFEKGLIEYMYDFVKKNPSKVDNSRTPYTGSADYVVDLIKYFTKIYDDVDYLTAVSIGAAESGYYKVNYMLRCNNVYGGMSGSGLIKYKNIEYGVLSYIRLLSSNYYGKGLNTLESIGRVYCPTINDYGEKVVSSHWINLVTKAMNHYEDDNSITVSELVND